MLKLNLYFVWFFVLLMFSMVMIFYSMNFMMENSSVMLEWNFVNLNSVSVTYMIYMDWISMIFSFVVLLISSMVVLYSSVYMGYYSYSSIRFLFLVLLFVMSMLLMILSPNMISIMLGWDGLGLVSYCLVIYYSSVKSFLAGMVTCLINRLGDIGLLISISWIFSYGSWNFIFYMDFFNEMIFYIIILSSFTKSAQIPFSVWLPAAMAAPTPVSSLVHSSTLVTAGVYLLIRFYKYLMFVNIFLLYVSLMTLLMSSLCASYEFDLKKIIALSTLSQLGLMMSCLFMGLVDLAFFHLLSHAMFKSLLFLCSGIMIHLMGGCQDIRMMGSICLTMPYTCCCFNISNMALCGFPFLSGFYSKDLIVESMSFQGINVLIFLLMFFSLGLTSFYSVRLFYYSILHNFNFSCLLNLGDNIFLMKISIGMLSLFSLSFGCLYMWMLNLDMKFLTLPLYLKILTVIMVTLGLYLGYEFSCMMYMLSLYFYHFNGSMWFMYSYSNELFKLSFYLGKNSNYSMLWGEFFGGLGLSFYLMKLSNLMQLFSLSSLSIFFVTIIIWMFFMI
uniref:NADH dehydrogenase subunit 5 n=1 Tax=Abrus yunshanensis TaxID=2959345 RepID=UPI002114D714|nr:NADH dehydrogenase subunit 5 [Abrus yunshanensis]USS62532.1 NADH dehydrogenase subunit 5 [Abrus yunshanensis]